MQVNEKKIGELEFIGVLAVLMSLAAYSIDAMLPALSTIGADFNVGDSNQPQLIISFLFIGLSLGQLFYGPLSDSLGRRRTIFIGLSFFMLGSTICSFSESLTVMLCGRLLQGFGASGPRIVSMALVRDKFKGDAMARIMSFVMAVFIIVPTLAPAIGQFFLVLFEHWRAIFISQLVLGVIALIWFGRRLPETLPAERRKKFSATQFAAAVRITFKSKSSICYALASGFIYSAFMGYLNSAQQVFQEYFKLGDKLPIFFGILALALGGASFANSQLVLKMGMKKLVLMSTSMLTIVSVFYFGLMLVAPEFINLTTFMTTMFVVFFCSGILFGNLSSLALEPLGEVAGTASAVIGTLQSAISVTVGLYIGQQYDGTLFPMLAGFAVMGVFTLAALYFAKKNELKEPGLVMT